MSGAPLRVERDDEGIALLTLDRPDARNAVNDELAEALHASLEDAADDPATRALIVTGAGEAFCAGGDLARFERKWTPSAEALAQTSLIATPEHRDAVVRARERRTGA